MTVLRGFISASNAQYRRTGLDEYQMRVERDGSVTMPDRPAPQFKPPRGTGSAAPAQAAAGADQPSPSPSPSAGAAPAAQGAAGDARRAGDPPLFTSLKPSSSGFALRWEAVPGAARYGIYVDGALTGHVTAPSFDGSVPVGSGGVIQVDAVHADGTRTHLTAPMLVARTASGRLDVSDPRKLAAAAQAAQAQAAQAQAAQAQPAQAQAAQAQAAQAQQATAVPAAAATAPAAPTT